MFDNFYDFTFNRVKKTSLKRVHPEDEYNEKTTS